MRQGPTGRAKPGQLSSFPIAYDSLSGRTRQPQPPGEIEGETPFAGGQAGVAGATTRFSPLALLPRLSAGLLWAAMTWVRDKARRGSHCWLGNSGAPFPGRACGGRGRGGNAGRSAAAAPWEEASVPVPDGKLVAGPIEFFSWNGSARGPADDDGGTYCQTPERWGGCQWRSKMSHLWRLKMSHSAGGDEPLVRRRLPAASLPPRLIVPHLTAGGLEGLVELGVVAHAVAVAADAHDVAVVEQAVDQRGRHDLVAKDLAPLLEALVAGEHGRGRLVAPGHELEEEHGPGAAHWQIADLVHHEDGGVGEHLEPLLELACGLGLFQAGDEVGERAVVDAPAALGCGNRQADGQVGLADPGRAEEDHVLLALHKAQLVQALDLLAPDARLEAEVEALERLDRRQSGGAHGGRGAAVVSAFDLGRQQRFARLCAGQCPAVHAGEDRVDRLQCAGQLEIGQHAPDPLSQRGARLHRAPPATAA